MMKCWIPQCVMLTMFLHGCANHVVQGPQGDYQTVAVDVSQQAEQVRQLNTQALHAIERKDWDKAERLLKHALVIDVMFGPAHNNLGRVYFARHQLYLAAWEFEYAAKLMPHHVEPLNNLGMVHETIGRFDQAMASYTRALEKQPNHPQVLGNLARCRIRGGLKDDHTRHLLDQLLLHETREDWRQWTQKQRALLGPATTEPIHSMENQGDE